MAVGESRPCRRWVLISRPGEQLDSLQTAPTQRKCGDTGTLDRADKRAQSTYSTGSFPLKKASTWMYEPYRSLLQIASHLGGEFRTARQLRKNNSEGTLVCSCGLRTRYTLLDTLAGDLRLLLHEYVWSFLRVACSRFRPSRVKETQDISHSHHSFNKARRTL